MDLAKAIKASYPMI